MDGKNRRDDGLRYTCYAPLPRITTGFKTRTGINITLRVRSGIRLYRRAPLTLSRFEFTHVPIVAGHEAGMEQGLRDTERQGELQDGWVNEGGIDREQKARGNGNDIKCKNNMKPPSSGHDRDLWREISPVKIRG